MDDQAEERDPPRDGMGESAKGQEGGQTADDGPAATPLSSTVNQRPILDANGRFLPGVLQPVGKPWQPGQSGNPGGRPLGVGQLTRRLIAALQKDDGKLADALTTVIVRKALSGDYKFVQELVNRVEGRVAERLAGHDGGPLEPFTFVLGTQLQHKPPLDDGPGGESS